MPEGLNLKIADIVFSILPTGTMKEFSMDKNYIPFKTGDEPDVVLRASRDVISCSNHPSPLSSPQRGEGQGEGGFSGQKTDFILTVKRQSLPHVRYNRCKFNASIWDYYEVNGRHVFNFSYSSKNRHPERTLILESDFNTGEIILGKTVRGRNGILRNPFSYPLDQLLMISLLHKMQGLLIHSCGFVYKNKGYLFLGSSGAGKSTLSRILEKKNGVRVLNDDRIAVRKRYGRFYAYGTPWHGTAEIVSPEKAILGGLFFLKKSTENSLKKISLPDAVSKLIKCSFPPLWDKDGMASTLKICEDIAAAVPCFEFSFTPDNGAFNMIREEVL